MLRSDQMARPLRQLSAASVSRLVKVSGIITSLAPVRARAVAVRVQCSQCNKVSVGNPPAPSPPRLMKRTLAWWAHPLLAGCWYTAHPRILDHYLICV
jgi:hypothetical protein